MGDRANIVIREQGGGEVYLYSHWGGSEMPETLRRGLTRGRNRWDDDAYLARIIFCTMIEGKEAGETGFGISTAPCDNEYPYLIVDVPAQKVAIREFRGRGGPDAIPFEEYVSSAWTWDDDSGHLVKA